MSTYSPQPGDTIFPGAQAATELLSPVGGFIAGCGFAALDVILNATRGVSTSPAEVTAIIRQAMQEGNTVGNGGSATPADIMNVSAHDFGVSLQSMGINQALAAYAGVKPIEIGVGNARAFGGADSNVAGHYITVVGKAANGNYIVSDPNTPQSKSGQFVEYSAAQIAAARPFWAGVPRSPLISTGAGGGGGFNPLDPASWSAAISGGLSGAASQVGATFLGALGAASLKDFLWRAGLLIGGAMLILVALVVIGAGGVEEEGKQSLGAVKDVLPAVAAS